MRAQVIMVSGIVVSGRYAGMLKSHHRQQELESAVEGFRAGLPDADEGQSDGAYKGDEAEDDVRAGAASQVEDDGGHHILVPVLPQVVGDVGPVAGAFAHPRRGAGEEAEAKRQADDFVCRVCDVGDLYTRAASTSGRPQLSGGGAGRR